MQVFIHIPKTAGTMVRALVNSRKGDVACLYDYPSNVDLSSIDEDKQARIRQSSFVFGHQQYSSLRKNLEGAEYSTILRNPVDRVISFYNHVHQHYNLGGHRYSLLSFIETPQFQVQCNDYQTRFLCRSSVKGTLKNEHLEEALDVLRSNEVTAGVQELIQPTFRILPITQGLEPPKKLFNASENGFTRKSLTKHEIDALRACNRLDFALYSDVLERVRAFS